MKKFVEIVGILRVPGSKPNLRPEEIASEENKDNRSSAGFLRRQWQCTDENTEIAEEIKTVTRLVTVRIIKYEW